MIIPQSIPINTRRRVFFTATLASAPQTRMTSAAYTSLIANLVGRLTKDGAATAATTGTFAEVDATNMPGVLYYECALGEIDTPGVLVLRVGDPTDGMEPREIDITIDEATFGTAATGTLTTAAFTTSLAVADTDFMKDAWVRFLTGGLAGGAPKRIGSMSTSGLITLAANYTLAAAPANGDVFQIVNR